MAVKGYLVKTFDAEKFEEQLDYMLSQGYELHSWHVIQNKSSGILNRRIVAVFYNEKN